MSIIYRPSGRAAEYSHLAINHYIGCSHRCYYCYGPKVMKNPDFHTKPRVRENVLSQLLKEAPKFAGIDERVLLSFGCDAYQPLDTELSLTRDVILILRKHNIPFQVLTKGGHRADRDFDLYGPDDMFAATLTFTNDGQSLKAEPGAATPYERMQTLKFAHNRGIQTWVSLEPVIDMFQSLQLIDKTHSFVDHYKIGVLNHIASDINWRQFGIGAIKLCEAYGRSYFIKHDLAEHLQGISYVNTDIRKLEVRSEKLENKNLF